MKSSAALMALLAMTAMMPTENKGRYLDPNDGESVKKPIPAGCKEYFICGVTVVASNEKNALRKAKKLAGL